MLVNFDVHGGVAVNDRNEIIVCDLDNDRLQVFNGNGDFIRTIEHELLIGPRGICIDSAGRIYVTSENKILLFNPNGDYIKKICDEESQDADWYGITSDEHGNVIVCSQEDVNKAVHILSPEGKLLKQLSRDDFNPFDCLYYERKYSSLTWPPIQLTFLIVKESFLMKLANVVLEMENSVSLQD